MIPGLALSALSASVDARIPALEVVASLVGGTLAVALAFTSVARDQRITTETGWADTDWSVGSGPVISWLALSSRSARVGCAEVLSGELAARDEWISSETSWARADGLVVLDLAVGTLTADVGVGLPARIAALELDAGQAA